MRNKSKTLGSYISEGRHEFPAFVGVRDPDPTDDDSKSRGSRLVNSYFGVLVCDRRPSNKGEFADFFYKEKSEGEDSDVAHMNIPYNDTIVVSELPLTLSCGSFRVGFHFRKGTGKDEEGRRVLIEHGLF